MDESIWRRDLRDLSRRLSKGETLIVKLKKSCCPKVKNHLQLIGVLDPAYRDSFCDYLPDIDKFALLTDFVDAIIANTLSLERKLKAYRDRKKNEKYIKLNGQIISPELYNGTLTLKAGSRVYIPEEEFEKCLRNSDEECDDKKKKTIKTKTPETKLPTLKVAVDKELLEKVGYISNCSKQVEKQIDKLVESESKVASLAPNYITTLYRSSVYAKGSKLLIIDLPKSFKQDEAFVKALKDNLNESNDQIADHIRFLLNNFEELKKFSLRKLHIENAFVDHYIICEKKKATKSFKPELRISIH